MTRPLACGVSDTTRFGVSLTICRFAMRSSLRSLFLGFTLVATAACGGSDSGPTAPPPDIATTTFAPSLQVDLSAMTRDPSGLYRQDLVAGTGVTAQPGQRVTVHYTGWLANGTKFDSSVDRGTPFSFRLTTGAVITGWDLGIVGMKVGGKRRLIIPPSLGYGSGGFPPSIPGNAILVFDVELLGVG